MSKQCGLIGVELYDGVTQVTGIEEAHPDQLGPELIEHFSDTYALEEATRHAMCRIRDGDVHYDPRIVDMNLMYTNIIYESIGKYMQFAYTTWDVLPDTIGELNVNPPKHWYLYTRNGRWLYMNPDMRIPEMLENHIVTNT